MYASAWATPRRGELKHQDTGRALILRQLFALKCSRHIPLSLFVFPTRSLSNVNERLTDDAKTMEKSVLAALVFAIIAFAVAVYALGTLEKAKREIKANQAVIAQVTDYIETSVTPNLQYLCDQQQQQEAYYEDSDDTAATATIMEELANAMLNIPIGVVTTTTPPLVVSTVSTTKEGPSLPTVEEVSESEESEVASESEE